MPMTIDNARFGHTSEDTALLVDDYPYGYTLRTQIRYWIETTKRGDRFCSQTLNPKNGRWNTPKKSTYVDVAVLFIDDETGHVKWSGIRVHDRAEWVDQFVAITAGHLSDAQRAKVAQVRAVAKVMEHVTFEVVRTPSDPAERAARAAAADATTARIGQAIARETAAQLAAL